MFWLFILFLVYLEIKYKPRLDLIEDNFFKYLIVFYSTKTQCGSIKREFFKLLKF